MGRWSDRRAQGHAFHVKDGDRVVREEDWMMCVHCDRGWLVQPGSGTHRGWCFDCKGPLCLETPCRTCRTLARAKLQEQLGRYGKIEPGSALLIGQSVGPGVFQPTFGRP
jgi:hypothetical protein